jgi:hypothetical protein
MKTSRTAHSVILSLSKGAGADDKHRFDRPRDTTDGVRWKRYAENRGSAARIRSIARSIVASEAA